jgi:hypothetical protein
MQLTQPLREALVRIKKDPQLAPFVEHLRAEIAREHAAMVALEAPMVYRAQGRASFATDLAKLIENVDNVSALERPNSPPGRPKTAIPGMY